MEYIYVEQSLSEEMCQDIIKKYDDDTVSKYQGVTARGLDKNIKDTEDMIIPENDIWGDTNDFLSKELTKHLKIYIQNIEKGQNYKKENNYGVKYKHLDDNIIQESNFMIQKYTMKKGKYIYHNDAHIDSKKSRVITYLWYLNDIVEGGETEFFGGSLKIIPKAGKLLLFPALWTYPHRGNIPLSSNKYIITGWLYAEYTHSKDYIPSISLNNSYKIDNREHEQKKMIFDYFYKGNKSIFMDYKCKIQKKERILKNLNLFTYSPVMTKWLISHISNLKNTTKIEDVIDIKDFVTHSFRIIIDSFKEYYRLSCNFNIKEWLIVQKIESNTFDAIEYDLCIQMDVVSGFSFVGPLYMESKTDYQFVFFVEFTFDYIDKNKKNILLLKDIAENFIDFIDIIDPID